MCETNLWQLLLLIPILYIFIPILTIKPKQECTICKHKDKKLIGIAMIFNKLFCEKCAYKIIKDKQ